MSKRTALPEIDLTVTDEDGKRHRVTSVDFLAAPERAKGYMAAVRGWRSEYERNLAPLAGKKDQEENYEEEYERSQGRILKRFRIPDEIWFPAESGPTEEAAKQVLRLVEGWASGTLDDFGAFHALLDEELDLDDTFILCGIPIQSLSEGSQHKLIEAAERFGSRMLTRVGR